MRAMWDAKRATAAAIVGAAALLGSLIGAASAEAATARAYVLIEAADFAGAQHVAEALGRLHRCKGVSATLGPNEVVARVECDDLASLNSSVSGEIAAVPGVSRVTVMLVASGP